MNNDRFEMMLEKRGIKPTAIRNLILKTMLDTDQTVSIPDLENKLISVDKSTIFRTITQFLSHNLVHCIDDGTGSLKYAVCREECDCSLADLHSHFYCESCNKTFCMRSLPVPVVDLPEGFTLHGVNYVMKGLCDKCSHTKR